MAGTRILIIEDEPDLAFVLASTLQQEGYEALVAHDGQQGLRKAQT
jgi:DNA-binding response OmpR family regulator